MSINDKFESQEFYELMQTYRHSKTNEDTVKAFENVKEYATAESQQELARQALRISELEKALLEASYDVAAQLDAYRNLLPYKKHRFDAQKEVLDGIDNLLSTPTTTTHLDNYVMSRLEQVKDAFGNDVFPYSVYRLKESDKG